MSEIRRVIGPPGCGKTTYLARQCRKAVEKFGDQAALVVSLTRAAAREAGGRDTGLDEKMVGTLHAHCLRALGNPPLVTRSHVDEWNKLKPELALDVAEFPSSEDDPSERGGGEKGPGDELYRLAELYRANLLPREEWPRQDVATFMDDWDAFKAGSGLHDFTDLIERAVDDLPLPPKSPSVIFADEAQDLSRLELAVLRKWMASVDHVVLVGDPDQALYGWRGSDPEILNGERFKVLEQSYRVPRAVHEVAVRLIDEARHRQPVTYFPKKNEAGDVVDGWARRGQGALRQARRAVGEIEELVALGNTVMVLAATSVMLSPIVAELRKAGLPFHNPYNRRWNPLGGGVGISTAARVLAFESRDTVRDVKLFAPLLRSGGALQRGAKKRIDELDPGTSDQALAGMLPELFTDEAIAFLWGEPEAPLGDRLAWFRSHLLPEKAKVADFPLAVLERRGREALEDRPKIIVGTIHSVKGGEADVVYLFPDLSLAGYHSYRSDSWHGRDSVLRQFYVAVTRAKEGLVLAQPSRSVLSVRELAA